MKACSSDRSRMILISKFFCNSASNCFLIAWQYLDFHVSDVFIFIWNLLSGFSPKHSPCFAPYQVRSVILK